MALFSKKEKIIHIVILITAGILLCSVRSWVPSLFNMPNMTQGKFSDFSAKKDVFWSLDSYYAYADELTEKISFDGYAFCETTEDNSNRRVYLGLVSDKHSFYTQASVMDYGLIKTGDKNNREDNQQRYKYMVKTDALSVKGSTGFVVETASLSLPDDIYSLVLYVYENEKDYGIVDTGIKFQKSNSHFLAIYSPDILRQYTTSTDADQDHISGEIERAQRFQNGDMIIEGWLLTKTSQSSQYANVIVEASDQHGTVIYFQPQQQIRRPYLANTQSDDKYLFSGYRAVIPPTSGLSGNVKIRVFAEGKEKLYLSPMDKNLSY